MGEKSVGIMGGMGPEATVDLFHKILAATPAKIDQEHLHIIIDCNSKIPSRPAALLEGGPDPTPLLQATARNLERAGADFLVVACNTAHLFYDRIVEAVRIPVLHIVDEAIGEAQRRYPRLQSVGVLAGRGAIRLRLYQDRLEAKGIRAIVPSDTDQEIVVSVITRVKAGDRGPVVRSRIQEVAERLARAGSQVVFTGCTELPLVLEDGDVSVPILDPTAVLAEATVRFARGE
ncbi:MAG TPA: amino acid racemase [Candidatus Methylomirabilis sp.]|nr:amino acid racemase [Candidatus Methylomirabilis sp.]